MKLFGIEFIVRRVQPPEPQPMHRLRAACDAMNEAWAAAREQGLKMRPWIVWECKCVIITEWRGENIARYESPGFEVERKYDE